MSDIPLIGRLFARNRKESTQTDIILTLTPHIVRMLDVTEADLRPFRLGRGAERAAASTPVERPGIQQPPRDPATSRRQRARRPSHLPQRRHSRSRCSRRCRV